MFFLFMFIFMYMSILSKLLIIQIHPLSHLPSCIYFCGLIYIWICMYTVVVQNIHIPWSIFSFDDFHIFDKEFHIEHKCLFPWLCFSHNSSTLTLHDVFSWLCFHESYMCFIDFWVSIVEWFSCFHGYNLVLFLTWKTSY